MTRLGFRKLTPPTTPAAKLRRDDQMTTKTAIKSRTGALVGMATLGEDLDDGADLTALQRTTNEEMPGHVVSVATAQEIDAFKLQRRRVN
jgi:hypothetical protein